MKKVLIVEDETVVREKIIEAIDWSQDIVLAGAVENGAEALKICEQDHADSKIKRKKSAFKSCTFNRIF